MPTFVIQYRIPAEVQETEVEAETREHAIDNVVLANPDVEVEIVDCAEKDEPAPETPPDEVPPEQPAPIETSATA